MPQIPIRLLTYTLLREIGRGGMASVWYAENSVGRPFAIKLLNPELVVHEASVAERFRNEAQIMVKLDHPYIRRVEDYYEEDHTLAIIMEYLDGQDLHQYVRKNGRVEEYQAVSWFKQIVDAFGYVHSKGYFHRDVKPSNLFLTKTGQIKVMDFGIAKIVGTDLSLTQTDMLMGSPLYMSPEQILSPKRVDFRTDIYSLGVTLYMLLAGEKPYNDFERSMFSIQTDIVQAPLPRLSYVSEAINDAIQRATQKDPNERFTNCNEFSQALTIPSVQPWADELTLLNKVNNSPKHLQTPSNKENNTMLVNPSRTTVSIEPPVPFSVPEQRTVTSIRNTPTGKPIQTKSSLPLILGSLLGIGLLCLGAYFWLFRNQSIPANKGRQIANDSVDVSTKPEAVHFQQNEQLINRTIQHGIALYKQQRFDSALVLLEQYQLTPAFATDTEATTDLGIIYYYGSANIPQDLSKAEKWLQKGVYNNNAKAYYFLGLLKDGVNFTKIQKARGVDPEAVKLYKAGAERGDSYAQMTVGELFLQQNKYVQGENPCTVKIYLQQAVRQGIPEANIPLSALKNRGLCP